MIIKFSFRIPTDHESKSYIILNFFGLKYNIKLNVLIKFSFVIDREFEYYKILFYRFIILFLNSVDNVFFFNLVVVDVTFSAL